MDDFHETVYKSCCFFNKSFDLDLLVTFCHIFASAYRMAQSLKDNFTN
jgi:hypothetical protein